MTRLEVMRWNQLLDALEEAEALAAEDQRRK
jgi:ribosome assembly protein YihI (activator of Der GTPase)